MLTKVDIAINNIDLIATFAVLIVFIIIAPFMEREGDGDGG